MASRTSSSPAGAGGMDDAGLEPWRRFFGGLDVFSVLAHAILVAATDSPQEFLRRRDSIVEQIYTAPAVVRTTTPGRAAAGERPPGVAKRVPAENGGDDDDDVAAARTCEGGNNEEEKEMAAARRLATASNNQHVVHGHVEENNNAGGGDSVEMAGSDWLHVLADEMDEAKLETEEVLRIKAILVNHHEQSADVLFESLRRLQLMQLTVDKLKSTEIGVAVAALEKHKSHKIRKLVQDIAKAWKIVTDEWVAATKDATADDSNRFQDKSNTPTNTEDEGGLAIPPMDVGALFMSHATAIQNVSEFLDGMDDDGGILNNHITSMDKDGGSGSKRKCKGPRPSDTVTGTKQRPIIVHGLSATQGSLFKKTSPQKRRRCGIANELGHRHQGLEEREGQPLQRNDPINKTLNADGTTVYKTQVVLPKRQEVAFLATNIQKPKESRSRSGTRVAITCDKPSSTDGEPIRSLSKGGSTPKKTPPHEDDEPTRQNRGKVTFTGNPPIAAARKPLFGHVIKTAGTSEQSLESPKVVLGKRKNHLAAGMTLERTKHRLREAYQEAENAKRKRTIQVMEPHEIPKPMGKKRPVIK